MTTEKIKLGDQEFEIEVKPITLIAKAPNIIHDIQTPSRIMIDSQMTLEHVRYLHEKGHPFHPATEQFFKMVFQDYGQAGLTKGKPLAPDIVIREGTGAQHVAGLLDMSIQLICQGVQIGWRYPEAYLHPALQCQLADVLIALIAFGNTKKVDVTL